MMDFGSHITVLIQDRSQFLHARTVLLDSDLTAIDTETAGFDGRIIGISTYCLIKGREPLGVSFYFPFRHAHDASLFSDCENLPIAWLQELKPAIERADANWILHNFKFDLQKFWLEDIDIKGTVYDTMLMSWMHNENSVHALKGLSVLLGDDSADFEQKKLKKIAEALGGFDKVPPDVMAMYAEKDAVLTYRLFEYFKPLLESEEQMELLPVEIEFSRCLADMEFRGIRIDVDRAKQLAYETAGRLKAIQETLGFDPAKPSQLAYNLFAAPPEGLGLLPKELSKNRLASPITLSDGSRIENVPVMDKGTLASYPPNSVLDMVLEYRSRSKALSTWFLGFVEKADAEGRLHTTFKQHGTKTTRLSSAQPNVQQIPRTTDEERESGVSKSQVKSLFLPQRGCELWEFDYSQCEFRLGGCYAKEEAIIEGYKSGIDFHQLTATKLGITRQDAKTVNFAILYGAGPVKLAQQLGTTEAQGRQVLAEFREAYPALSAVARDVEKAAHRGWIRYWDGRRRHFEYPSEYFKAFNSVVQGGAARIMVKSMLDLYKLGAAEWVMHLQVHDSVWISIDEDYVDVATKQIKEVMEWPSERFPIPFPVDAKRLA